MVIITIRTIYDKFVNVIIWAQNMSSIYLSTQVQIKTQVDTAHWFDGCTTYFPHCNCHALAGALVLPPPSPPPSPLCPASAHDVCGDCARSSPHSGPAGPLLSPNRQRLCRSDMWRLLISFDNIHFWIYCEINTTIIIAQDHPLSFFNSNVCVHHNSNKGILGGWM